MRIAEDTRRVSREAVTRAKKDMLGKYWDELRGDDVPWAISRYKAFLDKGFACRFTNKDL